MSCLLDCFQVRLPPEPVELEMVERVSDGTADISESQEGVKGYVEYIIEECEKDGKPHTDPEFPIKENESDKILNLTKEWRRIDKVKVPDDESKSQWVMYDTPLPSDVIQGEIGNCWFVACLSAIADKPYLLDRIIVTKEYNPQGIYGLQLCVDGEWQNIIIDDRFPCNEQGKLVCAQSKRRQLWVPLIEKAMAKLFGSYQALEDGPFFTGMKFLTDCAVQSIYPNKEMKTDADKNAVYDKLKYAAKDKLLLCCMTQNFMSQTNEVDLLSKHAYTVLNVATVRGTRLLMLRNIWGSKCFTGDWSPNSDLWRTIPRQEHPADGTGCEDEAVFWISINDFTEYFGSVVICYARQNYHEHRVKAQLPRSGDAKWEVFEIEVLESTCIDVHFTPTTGLVVNPDFASIDATVVVCDEFNSVIGGTKAGQMISLIWTSKLLTQGKYKLYFLTFASWQDAEPIEYNLVCHSSREATCEPVLEDSSQIAVILMRLVSCRGTKSSAGDLTQYKLHGDYWNGWIIAVTNNSKVDAFEVQTRNYVCQNLTFTRQQSDTLDTIPCLHSQIIQVMTIDEPFSPALATYDIQYRKAQQGSTNTTSHIPPLTVDTEHVHRPLLTDDIHKVHVETETT